MSKRIPTLALLLLAGLVACSGPRQLDTSMGGRQMEEFRAEARKVEGQWWCELKLPLGHWRAETEEGQALDILPGGPRATLRWKVTPDRWVVGKITGEVSVRDISDKAILHAPAQGGGVVELPVAEEIQREHHHA